MATETQRWEYKVARFKASTFFKLGVDPAEVTEQLNQLGRDGWEPVHVVERDRYPTPVFYLKRPA